MAYGRYFEELQPGQTIRHEPGRTLTESDNQLFCLLTMNHHPLHIDAHYAAGTQHGQRVVVGTLVLSVAVGLSVGDISGKAIANLDYEQVKHILPVFIGDTIYATTTVLSKRESRGKPDRGIVQVETRVENQRGETVLTFQRRVLLPKAGAASAAGRPSGV